MLQIVGQVHSEKTTNPTGRVGLSPSPCSSSFSVADCVLYRMPHLQTGSTIVKLHESMYENSKMQVQFAAYERKLY